MEWDCEGETAIACICPGWVQSFWQSHPKENFPSGACYARIAALVMREDMD